MKLPLLILSATILALPSAASAAKTEIVPGAAWSDVSGRHINAHGGCVINHDGKYYWFGEDRTGYDSNGVSCYTSTDLYNWTRSGLVFKMAQAKDPETGKCILERPKVIYNDATGKWVMYIHWENGNGYGEARVCVAVCDKIDGEYEFVSTFRPNGHDSRDQTVFKDSDGKAYHFASTDMNTNMNVALLSSDYLATEKNPVTETKILNGLRYEAPAIIKVGDTYFGVFSGCTGWDPNPGHSATATDILGYWQPGKNFAIDKGASTTYSSQSTYIFKVEGREGAYVYMGDRWNSSDVGGKSEYVWLPLSVRSGAPTVKWRERWDMSAFDDCDRFSRIAAPADGAVVRILDKYSDRWMSTRGNGFFIDDDNDDTNIDFRLKATSEPYIWHFVDVSSGRYLESVMGAMMLSDANGKESQQWRLELEEDGCYRIQNCSDGKMLTVSGAAQLAGSTLFMSNSGASTAQSFGLYFDVREHADYDAADMFSAEYRAANRKAMEEQAEYEAPAGLDDVVACAEMSARADGCDALIVKTSVCAGIQAAVFEAASGRRVCDFGFIGDGGLMRVALPVSLAPGVYFVTLDSSAGRSVSKVAVR